MAFSRQRLVQTGALGFPGQHFVAYSFEDARRIAGYQATRGDFLAGFDETQRANDARFTNFGFVHYYGIHAHQHIAANLRTMYDGAMPNVRALLQMHRNARKHVDGAVFLHVAAIGYDNAAPVATQRGPWANIHIAANDDIASHYGLWVYKSTGVYYRVESFECVEHAGWIEEVIQTGEMRGLGVVMLGGLR